MAMSARSTQHDSQASMFLAEDSPAKTSAWLETARAWQDHVRASGGNSPGLLTLCARRGSSSKTFPVSCRLALGGIWEPSSERWGTWGMGSPTECWTLNGSDWPSDAVVSSLSDVLEMQGVPERYFLSPKACIGILRRAEKRGKRLPALLQQALERVAQADKSDSPTT